MSAFTVYGMRDERPCVVTWDDGRLSGRPDALAELRTLPLDEMVGRLHPEGPDFPLGLDTYEQAWVTVPLAFDWISETDGWVPEADTADTTTDEEPDVTLSEWIHPREFAGRWDSGKHARWPKGTPGGLGGKFRDKASAAKLSKLTGVPAAELLKNPEKATAGHAARKAGPKPAVKRKPIPDPHSPGAVTTSDPRKAAQLLAAGQPVNLKQPREVAILLEELGRIVKDAVAKGDKAPDYDLCKVTVKNTSLFCIESKGIMRQQMPQLKGKPVEGSSAYKRKKNPLDPDEEIDLTNDFVAYLNAKGYKSRKDTEHAAYLRPSQNELNGAKVASMVAWMRGGGDPNKGSSMLVTEDNYIVDGHHRWAATIGIDAMDNTLGNDVRLDVTRMDMEIIELLTEAVTFANANGIENAGFGAGAPA